ncbi:MAG: DUF3891 family protein [Vicinamibacterales bacterium]
MIVRDDGSTAVLITQPDHAALAARLMSAWRLGGLIDHPRRAAILRAVEEHDHGWRDLDVAPIVDEAGRLLDFVSAPVDLRQGVWYRGVDRLAATPWVAALVARHALEIYDRFRGDPAWTPFFAAMRERCDRHRADAGGSTPDLDADYEFVRIGDLLSLTFCANWPGEQRGAVRIARDDATVLVSPDPFGGLVVPFEVPAREMPAGPFASAAAAAEAWSMARRVTLTGTARGAAPA